eukprot:1189651-Prorocentrum_minimum.AAC.1
MRRIDYLASPTPSDGRAGFESTAPARLSQGVVASAPVVARPAWGGGKGDGDTSRAVHYSSGQRRAPSQVPAPPLEKHLGVQSKLERLRQLNQEGGSLFGRQITNV